MLRRWFFIFTLALLFGLGQEGAAVHAISHYADWQAQQHDQAPHGQQACDQCVVYAKLGNAVGNPFFILSIATASLPDWTPLRLPAESVATLHYQARGPPLYS